MASRMFATSRDVTVEYHSIEDLEDRFGSVPGHIVTSLEDSRERQQAVLLHYSTSVAALDADLFVACFDIQNSTGPVCGKTELLSTDPWDGRRR